MKNHLDTMEPREYTHPNLSGREFSGHGNEDDVYDDDSRGGRKLRLLFRMHSSEEQRMMIPEAYSRIHRITCRSTDG